MKYDLVCQIKFLFLNQSLCDELTYKCINIRHLTKIWFGVTVGKYTI